MSNQIEFLKKSEKRARKFRSPKLNQLEVIIDWDASNW